MRVPKATIPMDFDADRIEALEAQIVQMREALERIRAHIAGGPNPTPLEVIAKIDLLASQALAALAKGGAA